MHIINFLVTLYTTYGVDILIVVAFVALMILLYKRGKKELVKTIIGNLVAKAEIVLGSGTGDLKYSMVIANLYDKLPILIRLIFSKKEIDNYIIEAVKALKLYLGQGKNLLTYNQEAVIAQLPADQVISNAEINNIP